jgi:hypothetical protein
MPKHTALDVYTCGTRVRSLVLLDEGEYLPIGTEGTILEAHITASGTQYLIDFDGSVYESSLLFAAEVEEVPADAQGFRAVYAAHEKQWRWMNPETNIIAGRGDTAEQARADAHARYCREGIYGCPSGAAKTVYIVGGKYRRATLDAAEALADKIRRKTGCIVSVEMRVR